MVNTITFSALSQQEFPDRLTIHRTYHTLEVTMATNMALVTQAKELIVMTDELERQLKSWWN